jgi:type I restriction enzyme S subunit
MEVMSGYKQTEIGVIPEDWIVASMQELTVLIGDGLHGAPNYSSNGKYFFINGNNLNGGKVVITSHTKTVDHSEFIKYQKNLSDRSILMSINGTVGSLGLFDGEKVVLGKSVAYINVKPEYSKNFIYQALQTRVVNQQFFDGLTGSTISNLGLAAIRQTKIALPSLEAEQVAIAGALLDLDLLLESLDCLITKKRNLKQAAMHQLLTGRVRLPGFSGVWKVRRLGELAGMGSGGTPLSSIAAYYDGDIPWVSIADMTRGGKVIRKTERNLTSLGYEKSSAQMFSSGTVLYAMYASLGECSIAGDSLCTSQAILGIRPKTGLSSEFLYYYLTSLKSTIKLLGQQGTQSNLNKSMVQNFVLNLPGLTEQIAIAKILSEMDLELVNLEARRKKTALLKQGMMQELLTGKTRLI